MRTVEIPGGTATFRDQREEFRGRDVKLIKAASMAAAPAIAQMPDFDMKQEEDETDEDYAVRVALFAKDLNLTGKQATALIDMQEATAVACLASWTLKDERGAKRDLPKSIDDLEDLEVELYDALIDAAGKDQAALTKALKGTDFSPNPDKNSPTNGSTSLNGLSKDNQEPASTQMSLSSGENTPTESSSEEG
ncbi:MAG: hypothetical protein KGL39_04355 [Patescibacteria group bacterium]|nr:hypothetical protein [Patescibacteria group bacterium]